MVKFSTRCVVACLLTIGMCFLQYNLFFRNFKFKWWIDLGKGEKSHLEKKFPSALIVGVRKGGTRALLDAIALHPKVRIVRRETHFFDSNYTLGFDWYRDQMPEVENDNEIVIEKTPAYFTNEHVPKRVYEMNPDMKLILIVRHPVYRTVSDFTQVYYNKLEQNKTLPVLSVEAFKTNEAGIEKINMEYKPMTNSLYDVHISKWLKYFDLKNFLFVNGDVFRANPLRELRKVEEFLGLERSITPSQLVFDYNKGFFCFRKTTKVRCLGLSKDVIQSASQHYSSDGYLLIQIEMRISTDKMSASILILATCHQVLADFNSYVVPQPHAQRDHRQDISQHYDYLMEENDEPLGRGAAPSKYRSSHGQAQHRPEMTESENFAQPNTESVFSSGGVDSYGETRDFLQFLRRIQYDHRQVPENEKGEATYVEVSVVVSNIRAVSEVTMDYALELFYRESWRDPRLQYDRKLFKNKTELALHESYTNFLWFPDTFVPNAIASKNPQRNSISHRSLLRLDETGKLLYSRRISLVCECTMDLTLFPFDKQLCKLGIESYGYTADHVVYKWSKGARTALELKKIRLPDFTIQEAYVTSQMESYATGNYSRLYVCFVFSRSSGFCFLQLIIPSTAVVITSWVSLWMETETEFQDMISIILAITFLIFSYNEMMPRVSYIKAMDIYLGVCFMIVFLSLIKLALVKYMRQKIMLTSDSGNSLREMSQMSTRQRLRARKTSNMNFRNNGGGSIPINEEHQQMLTVPNGEDKMANGDDKEANNNGKSHLSDMLEIRITQRTMHRFHWISQMLFFFGFVIFCLFYFLIYPNLHIVSVDPACDKNLAEWFADIY